VEPGIQYSNEHEMLSNHIYLLIHHASSPSETFVPFPLSTCLECAIEQAFSGLGILQSGAQVCYIVKKISVDVHSISSQLCFTHTCVHTW